MDDRLEGRMTTILYAVAFVDMLFVALLNRQNPWIVLSLSGLLIVSITVRKALIYESGKYYHAGKITILTDIILVFIINVFDKSAGSQVYYFILIGDASIAYSYVYSGSVTVLCYLTYVWGRYISWDYPDMGVFLPKVLFNALSLAFVCMFAFMYIIKYLIKQREMLSKTMYELKVKTRQLENTCVKLKEASAELEEVTALRERNRIAREIHDTVGHTLTTVLVEMEAGERLVEVDPGLAVEKIRLAKGQIRKGLGDIRKSVSALYTGKEITDFVSSIKLLIEETTRHGEVYIKYEIGSLPILTEKQEKALYRALQEGLTNGIKHGKSSAFVFRLTSENGYIKFILQDNGMGTDKITQGFGLKSMEERITGLGGVFNINSKYGRGCCINISIPIMEGKSNGPDQGVDSR